MSFFIENQIGVCIEDGFDTFESALSYKEFYENISRDVCVIKEE